MGSDSHQRNNEYQVNFTNDWFYCGSENTVQENRIVPSKTEWELNW